MTQAIHSAIEESVLQNRIVHINAPTSADLDDLLTECDDWAENGSVLEFWGEVELLGAWRVHAVVPSGVQLTSNGFAKVS